MQNSGDEGIQFFIELRLSIIRVCHGGSIGTDEGSGSLPAQRNLSFMRRSLRPFFYAIKFLYDMVFNRKADTSLTSFFIVAATPKEGVATTNLPELAFVGVVKGAAELPCCPYYRRTTLWPKPPVCRIAAIFSALVTKSYISSYSSFCNHTCSNDTVKRDLPC